jgi:hypothetical protein
MHRFRVPLLIIIGCAIGLGLGLILGWVVWPTQFTDANPAVLQTQYRREYIQMIAATYTLDGDLTAAQQRLATVGQDHQELLISLLLDMILQQQDERDIRQLTRLANDLGLYTPAMDPYLPTSSSEPSS